MNKDANKELVKTFIEAIGEGKVSEAMEYLTPDFTWTAMGGEPPMGDMLGERDREAVFAMFDGVIKSMPDFHFEIRSLTAEDDRVSMEAMSRAHMENGKQYYNCYHIMFVVKEDKIALVREYSDSLYASIVLAGNEV